MRPTNLIVRFTVLVGVMTLAVAIAPAAPDLGDLLRESNWDRVVGTWVDADTHGDIVKTTYSWKIEDKVVEITTEEPNKKSIGFMGVNGKTGDVFHMGVDSDGGSALGKWELDGEDAVLGFVYTTGDGQEGALSIRHRLEDEDTLIVTLELPDPIKFKMIREKSEK